MHTFDLGLLPTRLIFLCWLCQLLISFIFSLFQEKFIKVFYIPNSLLHGTPLQYSCLEDPMDGGAWWAVFHGVAKGWTWLSDFIFTFHFPALEKEMATHSSVLAWRIPGTGEPGALPSIGLHRVRHDWSDLAAAAAACIHRGVGR